MNRLYAQNTDSNINGNYAKSKAYRYDKLGNMTHQYAYKGLNNSGGAHSESIGKYTYYADKPHAVKSAGSRSYTYDAVGNMTHRNGDTITYNPLSKPAILKNGKEVRFYYGVGGQRFMKTTAEKQTFYIGKGYEEEVSSNSSSETKSTIYITVGGKTVGTHVETVDSNYVAGNAKYKTTYNRYFHADALGSITAITNDAGTVVERRSYEPFGKIRAMDYGLKSNNAIIPANTVTQTARAFTGHEQIAELSGLIHMNARVYDSDIGRFLSADTMVQDPYDSQAYNRYSYVRNNPLVFTDPSGHSWLSKAWKKAKKWVKKKFKKVKKWIKKKAKKIIGAILTVAGVYVSLIPGFQTVGYSMISSGVSLLNYKPGQNNYRVGIGVHGNPGITVGTFGGNATAVDNAAQQAHIDEMETAYEARVETLAGMQNNTNSSSDNTKYSNGIVTSSYGNMNAENYLTLSISAPSPETEARINAALMADLAKIGDVYYGIFTYTNIGGVYDVVVEYYDGEIGGYSAGAQLGAAILLGGAGAKAVKSGFSSFGEARRLYNEWGKGRQNTIGANIRDHVDYRGNGNYAKYMRQASNFNKRGAHSSGIRDDGSILYTRRNGEFLVERDGLIVTYGRN